MAGKKENIIIPFEASRGVYNTTTTSLGQLTGLTFAYETTEKILARKQAYLENRRLEKQRQRDAENLEAWRYWRTRDWDWWCREYPHLINAFISRFSSKDKNSLYKRTFYYRHYLFDHILSAYNRHKAQFRKMQREEAAQKAFKKRLLDRYYNNRFSFLSEQTCRRDSSDDECTVQVEEEVVSYRKRKSNRYNSDIAQRKSGNMLYFCREEKKVERNQKLLSRLRDILFMLNFSKRSKSFKNFVKLNYSNVKINFYNIVSLIRAYADKHIYDGVEVGEEALSIQYEMEEPGPHGDEELSQAQASNVVITETSEESTACTTELQVKTWSEYCSSEAKVDYEALVNRWMQVKTFEWKKDDAVGSLLYECVLPRDYVLSVSESQLCSVPNSLPFLIHRYWRGDVEVKIHINSNRFQVGSLQCAWLYQPYLDANINVRKNIYSLSQTNHVIVNASTSNEATLLIPFKFYVPLLHTKPRVDMKKPLNLGSLYVSVLNSLSTPDSVDSKCNITIFARCINNEFTGMLSGNIDPIKYEMMSLGKNLGELALNSIFPDNNRDNPPVVRAPRFLVPTASHSWCVGTNLSEPLHPLRLDARGQTPHPPGIEISDEMEIKRICGVFGLLTQIKWNKDHSIGDQLYRYPVAPLTDQSYYFSVPGDEQKRELPMYMIPPVGVVSSMFMGWRGTLEFRFDIVASQYHTGRLMIGFVPGIVNETFMSMEALRCSTNVVISITDTTSFTYEVPFISNKPVWPRRYGGDFEVQDTVAPAYMYVYVLNKLVPMSSVTNEIVMNVYVRGGKDFELLVPVQPSLGLSWNRLYMSSGNFPSQIKPVEGFDPYYSGSFEDFDTAQVFRWGQYSHQIAHFNNANYHDELSKQYSYSKLDISLPENKGKNLPKYYTGVGLVGIQHAVFVYLDQLGYIVGIPTSNEDNAKKLARNLFVNRLSLNDPANKDFVISNTLSTTSNTFGDVGLIWSVIRVDDKVSYEIGEQDLNSTMVGVGTTNTVSDGLVLYGERFSSLKDLCRRYQYVATMRTILGERSNMEFVKFKFPATPIGLLLHLGTPANINHLHNRLRDGHIPIISSGFRYFRGGLRYRLVCNINISDGCTIIIQHRPDRTISKYSILSQVKTISGDVVMNHTYSSYIQFTLVNNIIEFEVPFYLMGMYGLLQQAVLSDKENEALDFYSLGDICVSVLSERVAKSSVRFDIFYSIADDMSFSTFQGFPPSVILNNIPPETPNVNVSDLSEIEYEMGLLDIFGLKQTAEEVVTNSISTVANDNINCLSNTVKDAMTSIVDDIASKFKHYDFSNTENLVLMGLEILHLINHRDISTLCLVVIKILIHFKMIVVNNLWYCVQTLATMLKSWLARVALNEPRTEEGSSITPEMDCKTILLEEWSGVVGMLFVGVGAALGLKALPSFEVKYISSFISHTIPSLTRGATFLVGFFTVIGALVSRLGRYIINKVYPMEGWYHSLSEEMPTVKRWMEEVLYLDGIDIESRVYDREHLRDRIFGAYVFGQRILAHFGGEREGHMIIKIFERIRLKYNTMVELGTHPFVRKEPFVLWMCGKTRIGKSYLTEHLSKRLLDSINYRLNGNGRVYNIMPTNEFWNGCKQQPVLCMDDAFSVETGQTLERTLNYMYMVKSSCTLNPPQAALDNKQHRYNPEIFYINSNKQFLNIANVDPSAIHSRRDLLVRAEVKDPKRPAAKDYTKEETKNFGHLVFFISTDPCNVQCSWDGPYVYEEFVTRACERYKSFYENECQAFQHRLNTYDSIDYECTEEDAKFVRTLADEVQCMKDTLLEMYENDLSSCLVTQVDECWKRMCAWSESKVKELFNRYTDINIKNEMDDGEDSDDSSINQVEPTVTKVEIHNVPIISTISRAAEIAANIDPISECIEPEREEKFIKFTVDKEVYQLPNTLPDKVITFLSETPHIFRSFGHMLPDHVAEEDFYERLQSYNSYFATCHYENWVPGLNMRAIDEDTVKRWNLRFKWVDAPASKCKKIVDYLVFRSITCKGLYDALKNLNFIYHKELFQNYEDVFKFDNNHTIEFCLMNYFKYFKFGKFERHNFEVCFEKLLIALKDEYSGCTHLERNLRWDEGSKVYRNSKISVPDSECKSLSSSYECIFGVRGLCHLYCAYHLLRSTYSFYVLKKDPCASDIPQTFHRGEGKHSLVKSMREWSSGFFARAREFIIKKIPANILKVFKIMCIIGSLVASFMLGLMSIKGLVNCSRKGFSIDNFFGEGQGTSTASGSEVSGVKNEQCPYAVSEGYNVAPVKHAVSNKVPLVPESNSENFDNIVKLIQGNAFFLECQFVDSKGKTGVVRGRGLKISGHHALMIRHYFEQFNSIVEKYGTVYFYYVTGETKGPKCQIDYKKLSFKYFNHTDDKYGCNFLVVKLPPNVPMGRDIRKCIATVETHKLAGSGCSLIEYGKGNHLNLSCEWTGEFLISGDSVMTETKVAHAYRYGIHEKGMCGSVLMTNTKSVCPIIGMHVAGGNAYGYSEPLYREMFDFLDKEVKGLPVVDEPMASVVIEYQAEPTIELETTVFVEACVGKENAHIETGLTSYTKSLIYLEFPVTTEPNPLKFNDERLPPGTSPMKAGVELMGMPVRVFEKTALERSYNDYLNMVLANCYPLRRKVGVLSEHEAICGIPDLEYYDSLCWNTSPGFNFKDPAPSHKRKGGKRYLFDLEETNNGYKCKAIDKRLMTIMFEKHEMRKQKIVPQTVFVDCLKDTCIDVEKCKIPGKTRIFSISPVDFTIQFKQYCGDFMAAFTSARFACEHAIGISVNGPDWSDLANFLQQKNQKFITGDYSNYGPGLSLEVANMAFDIIIEWYRFHGATEEHLQILDIMRYEIIGARHLCFNVMYQVCCGIPSGSPITSILNSMVNSMYIRYAYYSLIQEKINSKTSRIINFFSKQDPTCCDYLYFTNNVCLVTYGDDLIMSVTDNVIEEFNFNTISKFFGLHNIKFTPADKGALMPPPFFTSLRGLSFLSCEFKMHPFRHCHWLAKLKEQSIYSCANWIKKKGDAKDNTLVNMQQCLLLSFGHGPTFYNKMLEKLRRIAVLRKMKFKPITWEEFDRNFFDECIIVNYDKICEYEC